MELIFLGLRYEYYSPLKYSPMRINGTIVFTRYDLECIGKAIAYLKKHYPQYISADQLSIEVALHIKRLQACFKRSTGSTVHLYQIKIRVENAKVDLTGTSLSMKIITRRHGFKDSSQFSKAFKKHTGQTPGEFRVATFGLEQNAWL